MSPIELNLKIYYSFNFFSGIFGIQNFLQKYIIGLAQPLCKSDVVITSRAISHEESARPRGFAWQRREAVSRIGIARPSTLAHAMSDTGSMLI
jgi:hypothetical protein